MWRALLQLGQATYSVLEREIPEVEGLPLHGLPVLRLLRWHGPKTVPAITAYLGLSAEAADDAIGALLAGGYVRHGEAEGLAVIELDAAGVQTARRIVDAQQARIGQAIHRVPPEHRELLAALLEQLAFGLVSDCAGIAMTCASCWAFDTRECVKHDANVNCAFCQARYTSLDVDLSETATDAPTIRHDAAQMGSKCFTHAHVDGRE